MAMKVVLVMRRLLTMGVFGWLLMTGCVSRPRTSDAGFYIKAKKGETITMIAARYNVAPADLSRANKIKLNQKLVNGQNIFIPTLHDPLRQYNNQNGQNESNSQRQVGTPYILWPVAGDVSSQYGQRQGRFHAGIDIRAGIGAGIKAAAEGKVVFAGWMRGYGRTIILDHNGYSTLYAHCSRLLFSLGQRVRNGQMIATVGSTGNATGPHLHFEYHTPAGVPLNPITYLYRQGSLVSSR